MKLVWFFQILGHNKIRQRLKGEIEIFWNCASCFAGAFLLIQMRGRNFCNFWCFKDPANLHGQIAPFITRHQRRPKWKKLGPKFINFFSSHQQIKRAYSGQFWASQVFPWTHTEKIHKTCYFLAQNSHSGILSNN